jgi:glutamate--cysteine ligase
MKHRCKFSANKNEYAKLLNSKKGVERECLRVTTHGRVSKKFHHKKLGSKLTHPHITTDYSEALLEFVTPAFEDTDRTYQFLKDLHKYTLEVIDSDEFLWPSSMPCFLETDDDINIADYGSSHSGRIKTLYREGLMHRYGKSMQVIAGVHYNYSYSEDLVNYLFENQDQWSDYKSFKNDFYMGVIRNFKRYSWLLVSMFSSSPLCDESFLQNKKHNLFQKTKQSFGKKFNTSLRMDRLGYTSDAQEIIKVCYNTLETYIESIEKARLTSYPAYEDIGLKDKNGEFKQLSTNILQIDNEFYSNIRPKRVARSGQSAMGALFEGGVEYLELRLLDINPFSEVGISKEQLYFLDVFMLFCARLESAKFDDFECLEVEKNFKSAVVHGRTETAPYFHRGVELGANELIKEIKNELLDCATLLENAFGKPYQKIAQELLSEVESKPGRLAVEQRKNIADGSFIDWSYDLGQKYKEKILADAYQDLSFEKLAQLAEDSLEKQKELEENTRGDFESFLNDYFSSIKVNQ